MKLHLCFPSAIGISNCPFIDEIQGPYKEIISKYKYEDNGFCYESPHLKKEFKKLNNWIQSELQEYVKAHEYTDEYECKESWLLDYKRGSSQDKHNHSGFMMSVLFFLEGHEHDSELTFFNPVEDMMNPLNVTPQNRKGEKTNDITHQSVFFPPKSGELIVWRSYLMHGIQPKIQECKRIVFTYNFGRK